MVYIVNKKGHPILALDALVIKTVILLRQFILISEY
jgi:hypothetical protein